MTSSLLGEPGYSWEFAGSFTTTKLLTANPFFVEYVGVAVTDPITLKLRVVLT